MNKNAESTETLESLSRDLKRMRLVFGATLIAISIILSVILPSVIRNTVFRVTNEPETRGYLTTLVELITGEPIMSSDEPPAFEDELGMDTSE